MLKTGKNIPVL